MFEYNWHIREKIADGWSKQFVDLRGEEFDVIWMYLWTVQDISSLKSAPGELSQPINDEKRDVL